MMAFCEKGRFVIAAALMAANLQVTADERDAITQAVAETKNDLLLDFNRLDTDYPTWKRAAEAEFGRFKSTTESTANRLELLRTLHRGTRDREGVVGNAPEPGKDVGSRSWREWRRVTPAMLSGADESIISADRFQVAPHNGELIYEAIDMSFPARGGLGFELHRRYSSHLDYDGPLGRGWDFNYNTRIITATQPLAEIVEFTLFWGGRRIRFTKEEGAWQPSRGEFLSTTIEHDSISITTPQLVKYHFEPASQGGPGEARWRLRAISTRHGDGLANRMTLEYVPTTDRISKITDPRGREVDFGYDGNGRLVQIVSGNQTAIYGYSDSGLLVRVDYGLHAAGTSLTVPRIVEYEYNETNRRSYLTSVSPSGAPYDFRVSYDDSRRVSRCGRHAGEKIREWRFTYLGNRTEVTPPSPRPTLAYEFEAAQDRRSLPVRRLIPAWDAEWRFSHNLDGLQEEVACPLGSVTRYEYDTLNVNPAMRANLLHVSERPSERYPTDLRSRGIEYEYHPQIARPLTVRHYEVGENEEKKVLREKQYAYRESDFSLVRSDDSGVILHYYPNRYGETAMVIDANGRATIHYYSDPGHQVRLYDFADGCPANGGLPVLVVDDATSDQIRQAALRLGVENLPQTEKFLVVAPIAQKRRMTWDENGNLIRERQDAIDTIRVFNRSGMEIVSNNTLTGVAVSRLTPWLATERIAREISPPEEGGFSEEFSALFGCHMVSETFAYGTLGGLSKHRESAEVFGEGGTPTYHYERYPDGTLKSIKNPLEVVRLDIYDEKTGHLLQRVLQGGDSQATLVDQCRYHPNGVLSEYVDHFGGHRQYRIDGFGTVVETDHPNGLLEKHVFDGIGRKKESVMFAGDKRVSQEEYRYNSIGKLEAVQTWRIAEDVEEAYTSAFYVYDVAGYLVAERGEHEAAWTYHLPDGLGRTVASQDPGGNRIFKLYKQGQPVLDAVAAYNASERSRLISSTLHLLDVAGRTYASMPIDNQGKLRGERAVVYQYDSISRLVMEKHVGLHEQRYALDSLGNVARLTVRPADGGQGAGVQQTDYLYLPNGMQERQVVSNNPLALFGSHNQQNPQSAKIVDAPQTTIYEYDELGRLAKTIQPDGVSVASIFNQHSLPKTMIWRHESAPDITLRSLELTYSSQGQVLTIADSSTGAELRKFSYDVFGNCVEALDTTLDGGTVATIWSFDSTGRPLYEKNIVDDIALPWQKITYNPSRGIVSASWQSLPVRSLTNWTSEKRTFDGGGRLASIHLDDSDSALCEWEYLGSLPASRSIRDSRLQTIHGYNAMNEPAAMTIRDVFSRDVLGELSYQYGPQGQALYNATRLKGPGGKDYSVAQYASFDYLRRMTAQNSERAIPSPNPLDRYRDVFDSENSFQAVNAQRFLYDQVGNLWATHSGDMKDDPSPEKLADCPGTVLTSPASILLEQPTHLRQSSIWELASNRDTTKAGFDENKKLKAESQVYDKLGNLVEFKGEFWNGQLTYAVSWELVYDPFGRLTKMTARAKEARGFVVEDQLVAELMFRYDSRNRRVVKKVVDHSIGNFTTTREEFTVYVGDNQALLFSKGRDGTEIELQEQYLWGGDSRELLMASLPMAKTEGIATPDRIRYYFQQDRGLNTVFITRVNRGRVETVTAASYLGFGDNATYANIEQISSSLRGSTQQHAIDGKLDSGMTARWINVPGTPQFIEMKVDNAAELAQLSIWTDHNFPETFEIYVLPPGGNSPTAGNLREWRMDAIKKQYLADVVHERNYQGKVRERDAVLPYKLSLRQLFGDRVVIYWTDHPRTNIDVRQFEILRMPSNPGSIAFAGQWLDRETNMYYQLNRYKLAGSNKFISPDPIGFIAGPNLYAYANNNPLEWHDPDGHFAHILWGAGIGAVLGGGSYALQMWITGGEWDTRQFLIRTGSGALAGAAFAALGPAFAYNAKAAGSMLQAAALKGLSQVPGGAAAGYLGAGSERLLTGRIIDGESWGEAAIAANRQGLKGAAIGGATAFAAGAIQGAVQFGRANPKAVQFGRANPKVHGLRVRQDDSLINPNRIDARGKSNLQRMEGGNAPIGPDGKGIDLHHLNQRKSGPVVEMTKTFHQENHALLHPRGNQPSLIDRPSFGKWRSQYWKTRALDFGGY